jgi:bifunctional non-homologous end joining protein LigD
MKEYARFQLLQKWQKQPSAPLAYYVFDLLWTQGTDLTSERVLRMPPATNSKSSLRCLESSWERMWKGMVRSFPKGRRRKGWRGLWPSAKTAFVNPGSGPPIGWKIKARLQQEFVVGGFSEGKGSRQNLGALLLSAYRNGIDLGAQFSQMECSTGATNSRPHNDNSHWLAN